MGNIIVLLWSFCIGQIVGYIGGALNHGSYDFVKTSIVVLLAGVVFILIGALCKPSEKIQQHK